MLYELTAKPNDIAYKNYSTENLNQSAQQVHAILDLFTIYNFLYYIFCIKYSYSTTYYPQKGEQKKGQQRCWPFFMKPPKRYVLHLYFTFHISR